MDLALWLIVVGVWATAFEARQIVRHNGKEIRDLQKMLGVTTDTMRESAKGVADQVASAAHAIRTNTR